MMRDVLRVDARGADPCEGRVVWSPAKSLWNTGMVSCAVAFAASTATPGAVALFIAATYASLLFGHSVGMHRRLIHRTYQAHPWLDGVLIYVGVLVGVAGPFGVIRVHDARDWAQRQKACHDFFAHRRSPIVDLFWQLNCKFKYKRPPLFVLEADTANNRWYRFLERTWMLQQLPLAAVFYAIGGWPWVVWGVFVRVSVSVVGHWSITYWCHNPGHRTWHVIGASVQAANLRGLGLLTYGECWHNNHHAFPESARIGIEPGQSDPGWWVIRWFERLGWVWDVGEPRPEDECEDLVRVTEPSPSTTHFTKALPRTGGRIV